MQAFQVRAGTYLDQPAPGVETLASDGLPGDGEYRGAKREVILFAREDVVEGIELAHTSRATHDPTGLGLW